MRTLILFITSIFSLVLMVSPAKAQTTFLGKILSVDGTPIPKTAISIQPEIKRDIFSGHYEDIIPAEDGSYQFKIREPGIYRIFFKGVFHHRISVPVMIYDQPSMRMNILLMPRYFNDGFYFTKDNYTDWIRVYGNFNDYSYETGKKFSLNSDGSISAFIPVVSDTLRYQVRGLTYGGGASVLPYADEYQLRKDGSFEAVLYNNLPNDSLEIRYDPQNTIPYKTHFPDGIDPLRIDLRGFFSLQNQKDENWIWPLSAIQPFNKTFYFAGWEMSDGIDIQKLKETQKEYAGNPYDVDFNDELEKVRTELRKEDLHPQQKTLLTMSYASILGWMERKTIFHQLPLLKNNQPDEQITEVVYDSEILRSITDIVPPFHPAWRFNNGAIDFLLSVAEDHQLFIEYFHEAVRVHPDDRTVHRIALSMIRHLGSAYDSVEEMPVYQLIVERYGERELAQDAHRAFSAHIPK